jgi:predicted negative regulator of RcsB-dependent stress response
MSWWEYNRNWMLVVAVIIVLLIIAWVASQSYHPAPR